MNIFSYIDKYSNYTFEEEQFNEIDNVIFSCLSYIDLNNYVESNSKTKRTINEVYNKYIKDHPTKEKAIVAKKTGIKILRYIYDTKRYKDLLLYNYKYIGNENEQFSALTIEINKKLVYISFEGTDHLISGWKEDFKMSYKFPVLSQKHAINYINKKFIFNNKKIIVGGHSKGGNLAIVSAMYALPPIRKRIISIYNNDGPGLIKKQIDSNNYKKIENKIIHIVPDYSFFGLLLRHKKNYIVIKSTKKSITAHNVITWVTENNTFRRSELSKFSKVLEKTSEKWLDQYDYKQREIFVEELFNIFTELNINSVLEIYEKKKNILSILSKSKNMDTESKNMIKDFIYKLVLQYKNYKFEEYE